MKYLFFTVLFFFSQFRSHAQPAVLPITDTAAKLIIITIDGLRWQEVFEGADANIISDPQFTSDSATATLMYGGNSSLEKRTRLMPFLWSVVAQKGQLHGNRQFGNKVNVANIYAVSYPGYSEMFTGKTDIIISGNKKINNPNHNIFEYLSARKGYINNIGIFTSWDVVPFILNKKRTGLNMNCGYYRLNDESQPLLEAINAFQDELEEKPGTRQDMLTFIAAKDYLQRHHPKILYLGLGETDEYAHAKNYDMYLRKCAEADRIINELWHWVETTPGYKGNTTFLITTDHGRGVGTRWASHGAFITGSSQTWVAMLGKNILPLGEVKEEAQLYQKQMAQTIAFLLGEHFGKQRPMIAVK